jgi:hypothetical protein
MTAALFFSPFSLEEARRERDRDQKNAKNKHSRNILNANGK